MPSGPSCVPEPPPPYPSLDTVEIETLPLVVTGAPFESTTVPLSRPIIASDIEMSVPVTVWPRSTETACACSIATTLG